MGLTRDNITAHRTPNAMATCTSGALRALGGAQRMRGHLQSTVQNMPSEALRI